MTGTITARCPRLTIICDICTEKVVADLDRTTARCKCGCTRAVIAYSPKEPLR